MVTYRELTRRTSEIDCFWGDCSSTTARVLIEEIDGKAVVRMHPGEIEPPDLNID